MELKQLREKSADDLKAHLVANVFDLGRDQRKDGPPVPDAGAVLADATAKVLCP